MMSLKPATAAPMPCPICAQPAPLFGVVDFNRNCEIPGGVKLPLTGVPVYHRRCVGCGFLFTADFDDWTEAEFKQFIYNDDYIQVDPGYLDDRPARNAGILIDLFGQNRSTIRILDYGGGNGLLAQCLRQANFTTAETYDPFTPEFSERPNAKFDLITSFETFEHLPDPLSAIDTMVDLLTPTGSVLFSTLLQPPEIEQLGMTWWYIGPRNGHISLFSKEALDLAWQRHGFTIKSYNVGTHMAYRNKT